MLKIVMKLNLIRLLAEIQNFRNDGWCQEGYRIQYKACLKEYIMKYPSLIDPPRE